MTEDKCRRTVEPDATVFKVFESPGIESRTSGRLFWLKGSVLFLKCCDNNSKYIITASLYALSNLLFIKHLGIRHYMPCSVDIACLKSKHNNLKHNTYTNTHSNYSGWFRHRLLEYYKLISFPVIFNGLWATSCENEHRTYHYHMNIVDHKNHNVETLSPSISFKVSSRYLLLHFFVCFPSLYGVEFITQLASPVALELSVPDGHAHSVCRSLNSFFFCLFNSTTSSNADHTYWGEVPWSTDKSCSFCFQHTEPIS